MKIDRSLLPVVCLAMALLAAPAAAGELEVGKSGGEFSLKAKGGGEVTLEGLLGAEGTKAVVVDITSYTCPYSLRADKELVPMAVDYSGRGVKFVGVYPNRHENWDGITAYASKVGFSHPVLRDPQGKVARAYGADVTPTFFVFDKGGVLRFRGSLKGVAAALDAVLAGEPVATPTSPSTGCTIKWPGAGDPSAPLSPGRPERPSAPDRARPDRPQPALSESAQAWLGTLIASLSSGDELVRRSAASGIAAMGPAAMSHLRKARETAEGPAARELDQLMARMRQGPGGRAGRRPEGGAQGRGPGAGGARRGGIERQKQFLTERLGLSEEQQAAMEKAFAPLIEKEKALRKAIEDGNREGARERYRQLQQDISSALDALLTPEQKEKLAELRRGMRRGGGGERRGRDR